MTILILLACAITAAAVYAAVRLVTRHPYVNLEDRLRSYR